MTHLGDTHFLTFRCQCRAADWRDLADRDLSAGVVEEAWMCSKDARGNAGFSCQPLCRQCLCHLHWLVDFVDNVPGQEILDAIDRMVGDPFEHVVQVALRIDVIELAASCRASDYAEPLHFSPVFPKFAEARYQNEERL
jgi:hypothetical protein